MAYKIEKNIEVTPSFHKESDLPLGKMQVGDSFKFPTEKIIVVRSATFNFKKKHSKLEFTVRQISKTEGRCWRLA